MAQIIEMEWKILFFKYNDNKKIIILFAYKLKQKYIIQSKKKKLLAK